MIEYRFKSFTPDPNTSRETEFKIVAVRRWIDVNKRDDGTYKMSDTDPSTEKGPQRVFTSKMVGFKGTFPYRDEHSYNTAYLWLAFDAETWDRIVAAREVLNALTLAYNHTIQHDYAVWWTLIELIASVKVPVVIDEVDD